MDIPHTKQKTVSANGKPVWLRIPQATALFGIGRTKLYELIKSKRIKSVSIRDRGKTRGTRLVSYEGLSEFIETNATGGEFTNH